MPVVHGEGARGRKSLEYKTWRGIRRRCNSNRPVEYASYKGRGITVCNRWTGHDGFINFLNDMGRRPSPTHSIDRIDNNKGYSPNNCRWATLVEQANNTRRSILITYKGETKTVKDWAATIGLSYSGLYGRLYTEGRSIEDAIETPKHSSRR